MMARRRKWAAILARQNDHCLDLPQWDLPQWDLPQWDLPQWDLPHWIDQVNVNEAY
jgi:hypothetical protein